MNTTDFSEEILSAIGKLDYKPVEVCIKPTKDSSGYETYKSLMKINGLDIFFDDDLKDKYSIRTIVNLNLLTKIRQKLLCKHNFKKSDYLHYHYERTPKYMMVVAGLYYREYKNVMKCKRCGHEEIGRYMGTSETGWAVHGPVDEWPIGFTELFNKVRESFGYENFDGFGSWWQCEFVSNAAKHFSSSGATSCRKYMETQLKSTLYPAKEK